MTNAPTANDNGYRYAELERKKIWVICEDCELLRSFDGNAIKTEFAATPAPSPLRMIAQKLIGCPKSKEDFGPRCRMSYYWTSEERSAKAAQKEESAGVRVFDLRSWEVVVAGCGSCKHVTELPRWKLLKMVGGNMPLKELQPRLKCRKCGEKGGSYITIAKLPR